MKFTKEEAREKITEQFSKKVEKIGDWERTIKENVETLFSLVGEDSEMELDDFVSKAMPLLETQLGHINKANKNVAASFDEKIKELQKQVEASKTKNPANQEPKNQKDPDEGLSNIEERLKNLEKELQQEKNAKTISQKKSELIAAVEQKGVKNKEWIEAMVGKISISESTDISAEADSFAALYNKFFSSTPKNITPAGGGGSNVSEHIKNVIKQAGEFNKNGI